jgi:hypothetical protein
MEKHDNPEEIFESYISSPTEPQSGLSFLQLSEPLAMPFLCDYEFCFPPTKVKEISNLETMKMTFMKNQPIRRKSSIEPEPIRRKTSIEPKPEPEATKDLSSLGLPNPISTSNLDVGTEVDRLIFLSPNQSKRFQKNRQIMQLNLNGSEKNLPPNLEPPSNPYCHRHRNSIDDTMKIREGIGLISTSQQEISEKKRHS